jgi:hypothetical protein
LGQSEYKSQEAKGQHGETKAIEDEDFIEWQMGKNQSLQKEFFLEDLDLSTP